MLASERELYSRILDLLGSKAEADELVALLGKIEGRYQLQRPEGLRGVPVDPRGTSSYSRSMPSETGTLAALVALAILAVPGTAAAAPAVDPEFWQTASPRSIASKLDGGADPDARDRIGRTVLMLAARKNTPQAIALILGRGADPKAVAPDGTTALMLAASDNGADAVRVLLDAGADPNARDKERMSSLHYAAIRNSGEVAKALLAAGASVEAKASDNRSPLMLAAATNRDPSMIAALLSGGAKVNETTPTFVYQGVRHGGWSALMYAAFGNSAEIVRALLDAGADTELRDVDGETALMAACIMNGPDVVELLLARGADRDAKDAEGKAALDYARRNGPLLKSPAYAKLAGH